MKKENLAIGKYLVLGGQEGLECEYKRRLGSMKDENALWVSKLAVVLGRN